MRCYVLALLFTCGLLVESHAFTLQSHARVNIVPGVEIQRISDPTNTPETQLATAAWGSGSESRVSFSINGPTDLWANVTLVDLTEAQLPRGITPQVDFASEGEFFLPQAGLSQEPGKGWRSVLLRVEYE